MRWTITLAIASIFLSFLSFYSFQEKWVVQDGAVCGTACETVQSSTYGRLFGIPTSFLGGMLFMFQAALLVLYTAHVHLHIRRLLAASYVIAPIAAITFLLIQAFILHAWCELCIIIDISVLITSSIWWLILWPRHIKKYFSS